MKPVVMWRDLPDAQRADEEFLTRVGQRVGSPYLRKYMRAMKHPDSCQAAGWRLLGRYLRCTNRTAAGQQFCGKHGGIKRRTVKATSPSQFAPTGG